MRDDLVFFKDRYNGLYIIEEYVLEEHFRRCLPAASVVAEGKNNETLYSIDFIV